MQRFAIFDTKKNRFWAVNSSGWTADTSKVGQYSTAKASELLEACGSLIAVDMRDLKKFAKKNLRKLEEVAGKEA